MSVSVFFLPLPLLLSLLSFFRSRFISRVAKTENAVPPLATQAGTAAANTATKRIAHEHKI